MTWYPPAHTMIKVHPRNAGPIEVKSFMQALAILRPELRPSLLDFVMAFRYALHSTPACIATLPTFHCFLASIRTLSIAFRLFAFALGALLAIPIHPWRLGLPRA